jgi:hypothetical protein
MALAAHRWLTTAPDAPLVRAAFDAAPQAGVGLVLDGKPELNPFVEPRRLDGINRILEAMQRRDIKRRAVLVP